MVVVVKVSTRSSSGNSTRSISSSSGYSSCTSSSIRSNDNSSSCRSSKLFNELTGRDQLIFIDI